ncbi:substrate-binding domain-containing protein [Streptomyces sp. PTD9-10]|uniref:sugar ABC transporter substrate-binding protein n=1 Tax=unclassified Streptomyces TaxID=2593676 RepID=UPI00300B42C5
MRARTRHVVAVLVAPLLALPVAACTGKDKTGADGFTVGLLLPSRTLPRWEHFDKPLIEKRLKSLCPRCDLEYANADNDVTRQQQQMNSMVLRGVKVLIIDATDVKALRSSIQQAHAAGVPVVAYDRLAEGPISGYVTFDGAKVGKLQAEALLKAMGDKANGGNIVMMNGDPTNPNAAWFRAGALSVLTGKVNIRRSYDTPGWSTDTAHNNMSAAIAAMGPGRIDGVLAANDSLAAGVISALKSAQVRDLPPVTGQDADLEAVQRIIKGEQLMTVYKPFPSEAGEAAAMAVALGRGESVRDIAMTTVDSPTTKNIPTVLLTPKAVTVADIRRTLIKDRLYTIEELCPPALRRACDKAGL